MKMKDPIVDAALQLDNRDQNTVSPGDIIDICDEICKSGILAMTYNRQENNTARVDVVGRVV